MHQIAAQQFKTCLSAEKLELEKAEKLYNLVKGTADEEGAKEKYLALLSKSNPQLGDYISQVSSGRMGAASSSTGQASGKSS